MSSFYDDASLVVIPSGYKTSKVYAEKPTDGSGDLAFTRTGDTATRVNSAGIIEKVRTNLILQSNTFSNASWGKNSCTVTSGQAGYDGTTNAWLLSSTATAASAYISQGYTASTIVTRSLYAKAGTVNWLAIFTTGNLQAYFDVQNGVIGTVSAGLTAKIELVGNGFYRCSVSQSTGNSMFLFVANADNNSNSNTGDNIIIQDAQLETSDIATDYIPTTTAAVSVGPVANVPRLDYLGSTCPRLLLEPQRTNLALYSEQFNNAAWVKSAGGTGTAPAVTANNATSPDGYQNADTIVFNAGAGTSASDQSIMYQALGSLSAGTYTGSFYAKTASGTAQIMMRHAGASNFTKFTITDQWQRFTSTEVKGSTSTAFLEILIRRGLNEPINASATIQLWGVQLELGAYATSYIPTLAASATRGADLTSKSGISSLIGQTEGTIFAEIEMVAGNGQIVILTSAAGNEVNRVQLYIDANRKIGLYRGDASVNILSANAYAVGSTLKIAAVYKANDYALYVNGVSVGTDTSATAPVTPAVLYLGQYVDGSKTTTISAKQALLFTTRLTNAQLAELTTL